MLFENDQQVMVSVSATGRSEGLQPNLYTSSHRQHIMVLSSFLLFKLPSSHGELSLHLLWLLSPPTQIHRIFLETSHFIAVEKSQTSQRDFFRLLV